MKPKVLAVDDDPAMVKVMKLAFNGEGYDVLSAASAQEARKILAEHAIALCLIDLHLPDGDGQQLVHEFRSCTSAVIIIVSGLDAEDGQITDWRLSADDYITKPFEIRDFRKRVNTAFLRGTQLAGR